MPLACFQYTDTLLFAAKHAKGMSLRYGVFMSQLFSGKDIVLGGLMRFF